MKDWNQIRFSRSHWTSVLSSDTQFKSGHIQFWHIKMKPVRKDLPGTLTLPTLHCSRSHFLDSSCPWKTSSWIKLLSFPRVMVSRSREPWTHTPHPPAPSWWQIVSHLRLSQAWPFLFAVCSSVITRLLLGVWRQGTATETWQEVSKHQVITHQYIVSKWTQNCVTPPPLHPLFWVFTVWINTILVSVAWKMHVLSFELFSQPFLLPLPPLSPYMLHLWIELYQKIIMTSPKILVKIKCSLSLPKDLMAVRLSSSLEPIFLPSSYMISSSQRGRLQRYIKDLLKVGIIQPSSSQWAWDTSLCPKGYKFETMYWLWRLNQTTIKPTKNKYPLRVCTGSHHEFEGIRTMNSNTTKSVQHEQGWGTPILRITVEDVEVPLLTCWGLLFMKSQCFADESHAGHTVPAVS